jgi:DNA-binding NarL/FixJ family response regulator
VIRVIVVDDHDVVRQGLETMLTATDDICCVGTAASGPAALELVNRLEPDVLLLDLSMPGQDGVAVLRALRARGHEVRVLVLTSFSDDELVLDAIQAGADGYLLKQNEAEAILEGVRSVSSGRAPIDPLVARSLLTNMRERGRAAKLTERELEVLDLLRQGQPNKTIARRLSISERTVKAHVTHIFQRIGVNDRTQAALWAERHLPGSFAARQGGP